jgi:hypothetical protein
VRWAGLAAFAAILSHASQRFHTTFPVDHIDNASFSAILATHSYRPHILMFSAGQYAAIMTGTQHNSQMLSLSSIYGRVSFCPGLCHTYIVAGSQADNCSSDRSTVRLPSLSDTGSTSTTLHYALPPQCPLNPFPPYPLTVIMLRAASSVAPAFTGSPAPAPVNYCSCHQSALYCCKLSDDRLEDASKQI